MGLISNVNLEGSNCLFIQKFIHLADNNNDDKTNKLYKVQSLIDYCNSKWPYYLVPQEKLCLD